MERDEHAVELWNKDVWPQAELTAAALGAFAVFEDDAGFGMTASRAPTWGRRGQTPVVRVRGRSWRRYSIAALCCYRPGEPSRLIFRPKRYVDHIRGGRRSFTWTDYRDLIVRAHIQLKAPIVLIWDKCAVRRFVCIPDSLGRNLEEHSWATGLTWRRKLKGTTACPESGDRPRRPRRCVARPARYGQSWIA